MIWGAFGAPHKGPKKNLKKKTKVKSQEIMPTAIHIHGTLRAGQQPQAKTSKIANNREIAFPTEKSRFKNTKRPSYSDLPRLKTIRKLREIKSSPSRSSKSSKSPMSVNRKTQLLSRTLNPSRRMSYKTARTSDCLRIPSFQACP